MGLNWAAPPSSELSICAIVGVSFFGCEQPPIRRRRSLSAACAERDKSIDGARCDRWSASDLRCLALPAAKGGLVGRHGLFNELHLNVARRRGVPAFGWRCVDVSLCGCCWIYLGTILRCVGGEESQVLRLTIQGDSGVGKS